jgi:hypothetical protein
LFQFVWSCCYAFVGWLRRRLSAERLLNLLSRLQQRRRGTPEVCTALLLEEPPQANVLRYDRLRQICGEDDHVQWHWRRLQGTVSLHGMASAGPEMLGTARMKALDHETVMHQLLKAERAQREVRSMAYQTRAARFPAHRDLDGFAFDQVRPTRSVR